MERDRLSLLDVVLIHSDDDQDRDEGANMVGEDFCMMTADKAGYRAALLLGQREPRTYNRKLPRADTFAAAVRIAKPTNKTFPVGCTSAFAVPTTQTCVGGWGGKQPPPSTSPLGTSRTTASADCAKSPPTVTAHAPGRPCIHWPYHPGVTIVYWLCRTVRLKGGARYAAPTSQIGAQHSQSTSVTTKPCPCVWFMAPHMLSHMLSRCPHDQNGPCVPPPVKRHSEGGPSAVLLNRGRTTTPEFPVERRCGVFPHCGIVVHNVGLDHKSLLQCLWAELGHVNERHLRNGNFLTAVSRSTEEHV